MGLRYLGNIIKPGYNPLASNITTGVNTAQYQGVFTLQQQAQAQNTQSWATDPLFENTTLLLQSDNAANGAQNNTFLDSSSNSFAITRNGNTTQGTFTPFSQAPGYWGNFFSGTTDNLQFASNATFGIGTSNFTIEFFLNVSVWSGNQRFFLIGQSGTDGLSIARGTGVDALVIDIGNTRIITYNWTPVISRWYHIALVRSGTGSNQVALYIDGISVATGTSASSIAQNALYVGGLTWASSYNVQGYISNMRFSNVARTITVPIAPYSSDANTLILTCQSNRFVDNSTANSGSGFAITVNGTPSVQPFTPFSPQLAYTASVIGGSGYFDGTGDYLNSTITAFGSGNFTIQCWVYLTSSVASKGIFHVATSSVLPSTVSGVALASGASGGWTLYYNNGSQNTNTSLTASLNTWIHLAVVKSSTTIYVYVNGVLNQSQTDTANYTNQVAAIGGFFSTSYLMTGYMSGFKVTNTADYSGTSTTTPNFTLPTAPPSPTSSILCCNFTNAGIYDTAAKNVLETVGNAQISTAVVKYGSGSMYFDGTGDYLTSFNGGGLFRLGTIYTVEMWFYTTTVAAGNAGLINFATTVSGNTGFNLYRSTAEILCNDGVTGGTGPSSGAGSVVANVWTHLAIVSNGVTTKVYLNGVERGSYTGTTGSANSMTYVTIGAFNDKTSAFAGYIDDLRITRGIARYTQNFIPPSVALPRQ